jgi:hypothetical protein
MMTDPRIALLDRLVAQLVPQRYFLATPGEARHFCCYVWFHGMTAIYVGEGELSRYASEITLRSERICFYFREHYDELTPAFAGSSITKNAGVASQYYLIQHFHRTVLNTRYDQRPMEPHADATDLLKPSASLAPCSPNTRKPRSMAASASCRQAFRR